MQATTKMEAALQDLAKRGLLVPRTENNKYLKVSYRGAGTDVPVTWNIKVYSSGSVVTTDDHLLASFLDGSFKQPDSRLKVLQCDDAGWGFPLCGVMVGVSDGEQLMTAVVDVRWFKKGVFETKGYLKEYSRLARDILWEHFTARPETHRVEICSGYVNSALKEDLRHDRFDVRIAKVTGFLQDRLEKSFKEYVHTALGADLAYDPKAMPDKASVARKYAAVLEWGRKNKPHMLKDGWGSMAGGRK
jgi:hypothetical protein